MSIDVIGFRILVKQDDVVKTKYKTDIPGFIVAGEDKQREQVAVDKGTVVAFGPTVFEDYKFENPLKVGDRIVFAKFAGKVVTDPATDEEFVIILDEDVVAKISAESAGA
jgi:co-chaperonin GroES (HSP10)